MKSGLQILFWVMLLVAGPALSVPRPALAHAGHPHHAIAVFFAKNCDLVGVWARTQVADHASIRHARTASSKRAPDRTLASAFRDELCCLGFGLSCCSSALVASHSCLAPPPWRGIALHAPPDRRDYSAELPMLPEPPDPSSKGGAARPFSVALPDFADEGSLYD